MHDATDPAPAVIVLPARRASTRFAGKPLAMLRGVDGIGKPLIQRSWEAALRVRGVAAVYIATDDAAIADVARGFGARVVMTSPECGNGTERCAEAVDTIGLGDAILVNLQGDAPLTPPEAIKALVAALRADPTIAVASPMVRCTPAMLETLLDEQRRGIVGGTTVVVDRRDDALYFSRRVLPYCAGARPPPVRLHVGAYAYRRAALARYRAADASELELAEGLEQLRFLDLGLAVRLVEIALPTGGLWEVNNPGDVARVEAALAARGLA